MQIFSSFPSLQIPKRAEESAARALSFENLADELHVLSSGNIADMLHRESEAMARMNEFLDAEQVLKHAPLHNVLTFSELGSFIYCVCC